IKNSGVGYAIRRTRRGGKVSRSLVQGRHIGLIKAPSANARSFVVEKEEGLVLDDRATDQAAELILGLGGPGPTRSIREVVIGVKDLVAQIFVNQAIEA